MSSSRPLASRQGRTTRSCVSNNRRPYGHKSPSSVARSSATNFETCSFLPRSKFAFTGPKSGRSRPETLGRPSTSFRLSVSKSRQLRRRDFFPLLESRLSALLSLLAFYSLLPPLRILLVSLPSCARRTPLPLGRSPCPHKVSRPVTSHRPADRAAPLLGSPIGLAVSDRTT